MFAYARYATDLHFASYALAYSIALLTVGLQRSLLVIPSLVLHTSGQSSLTIGQWVHGAIHFTIAALVATSGVAAATQVFGSPSWVADASFFCLFLVPTMCLYEAVRRFRYLGLGNTAPNRMSLTFAIFAIAAVVALVGLESTYLVPAALLGAGYIAGAALGMAGLGHDVLRPNTSIYRELATHRTQTAWHLASYVAYSTYMNGLPTLIAVVGTAGMVADSSATRTLITPVLAIVTAIDHVDKPAAGRALATDGSTGLTRSCAQTRRKLLALSLPWLLLLTALAPTILGAAFPSDHFARGPSLVWAWVVFALFSVFNQPSETWLIVQGLTRRLFVSKLAGCVTACLTLVILVPVAGALGAVIAATSGLFINALMNSIYIARAESIRT